MGRWSRQLAQVFIKWLGPEPRTHWLDVGCGAGSLTRAICEVAGPASVVACDPSESFIEYAREHIADPRVVFEVAGANDLPSRPDGFGAVVSGLVLNFLPNPRDAVAEMRDRVRPGGFVAAYVWDYAGRMEFLRCFWDEAVRLDPRACDEMDAAVRSRSESPLQLHS